MPTRKELLENLQSEMEYLSDSVRDNTDAHDQPLELNTSRRKGVTS